MARPTSTGTWVMRGAVAVAFITMLYFGLR